MPKKRHPAEEIITKLREAEVHLSQGQTIPQVYKKLGVSEQTYYKRRKEYNTIRPHSSLGYRPPVPEATQPRPFPVATLQETPEAEMSEILY